MTHPTTPPGPDRISDEAASHPITLTVINRPDVIAWLAWYGLTGTPPDDPGSDVVLVRLPGRTGVVSVGETLDRIGDTVVVGKPDDPRDLFPAFPDPTPVEATPEFPEVPGLAPELAERWKTAGAELARVVENLMGGPNAPTPGPIPDAVAEGPLRRPETPPKPAHGVAAIPPVLPDRVRLIEPPEAFTPLDEFEVALSTLGGIPGVDPWHDKFIVNAALRFCARFSDPRRRLAIVCPRRRDITRTLTPDELEDQVLWEFTQALISRDDGVNAFWFPRSTVDYPQPTSLVEYGHCRGERLRYAIGAHPLYHRRDVLKAQVPLDGHHLHNELDHVIDDALDLVADVFHYRANT